MSARPAAFTPCAEWISMNSSGPCAPVPYPSPPNTNGRPSVRVNW